MPTIHRLLRFLTNQGYVRQEASKRYALGLRMIRFGQSASRGLGSWATPYLAEPGREVRRDHQHGDARGRRLRLRRAGPLAPVHADVHRGRPGRHAALHRRRQGDPVHAHRPAGGRPARSAPGCPPRTEHTLVTADAMLAALAQARELGYALDDGEQELGVRCVAVPLTGLPFLAAISVSGPSGRLTMDDVPRIAPRAPDRRRPDQPQLPRERLGPAAPAGRFRRCLLSPTTLSRRTLSRPTTTSITSAPPT